MDRRQPNHQKYIAIIDKEERMQRKRAKEARSERETIKITKSEQAPQSPSLIVVSVLRVDASLLRGGRNTVRHMNVLSVAVLFH